MKNNFNMTKIKLLFSIIALAAVQNIFAQIAPQNLNTLLASATPPAGASLEWHSALPITAANLVANPTAADTGKYYAVYNYGGCTSTPTPVRVASIACGSTNTDVLNYVDAASLPSNTAISIHSANPANASNEITNTVVGAGTYYAAYKDVNTGCYSKPTLIKIVTAICPIPLPLPDINAAWSNVPTSGNLSTNDLNMPSTTTYGPISNNPSNPSSAVPTLNANGTYTFTASTPGTYSFLVPVQACPVCPIVNTPLVISVLDTTNNNNSPIANTDIGASAGGPITFNTLLNDGSVNGGANGTLDPSSVAVVDSPANGTVTVDPATGNITYTPNPGFFGVDTLYYEVCDGQSPPKCATAMQIAMVVDTNSQLNSTSASDDFKSVPVNGAVSGNLLYNDTDAEGDAQTVVPQNIVVPGKGTLNLLADGSYTFTPLAGFVGAVDFPYEVADSKGATAEATLHFIVKTSSPSALSLNVILNLMGNAQLGKNVLNFRVNTEDDVVKYFVYRKSNKEVEFKQIAIVEKAANQLYQVVDNKLVELAYTYKVEAKVIDGSIAKSNTLLLNSNFENGYIAPNPTSNITSLYFKANEIESIKISVVNVQGKVVRTIVTESNFGDNKIDVSLADLASGVYMLKVKFGTARNAVYKVTRN